MRISRKGIHFTRNVLIPVRGLPDVVQEVPVILNWTLTGPVWMIEGEDLAYQGFNDLAHEIRNRGLPVDYCRAQGYAISDLILFYMSQRFWDRCLVVLTNINVSTKPSDYWRALPRDVAIQFNEDVVVLFCRSQDEVKRIVETTGTDFAEATGMIYGKPNYSNRADWHDVETQEEP
jgi:hypothetical protein